MIELIIALAFVIPFAMMNGYIALQLEQMKAISDVMSNHYKGEWHVWAGVTVFAVFVSVSILNYGLTIDALKSFTVMLGVHFLLYDNVINLSRGKFSFRFAGTCEGKWDWDCVILKIDKIIPVNILRVLFFVAIIWWRFFL